MTPPTALAVAGSDSGGGAGIQADLKAFAATGVHGATAITSVTSQHTRGVERVDGLPVEGVRAQVGAVVSDLDVRAVKTGMLHTPHVVEAVADALSGLDAPVVVDPVMVATSGDELAEGRLEEALAELAEVTTLVTPNATELELLTGHAVEDLEDARAAAATMLEQGWANVLAKGGHVGEDGQAVDVLARGPEGETEHAYPRLEGPFHGAGCTYSSLIAGLLARGYPLDRAVAQARARMQRALEHAHEPGAGPAVPDALEACTPGPAAGAALGEAAWRIATRLPPTWAPEVGTNLAHAPEDATEPADVLALARRIRATADGTTPPGSVVEGGSRHVARVVLAAREVRPEVACAANLAHREPVLDAVEDAGLTTARFDRTREPEEADSTMAWGTTRALKRTPEADVVLDDGAPGKEAMVRVLAEHPDDLRATVLDLVEAAGR